MVWFAGLLGQRGERLAAQYLQRKGYRIVGRNFRTRRGEIDLICADGDCLVFVEVKTRTAGGLGAPEDAVTAAKQLRIRQAVAAYLARLPELPPSFRVDVISIEQFPDGRQQVVHYENITA